MRTDGERVRGRIGVVFQEPLLDPLLTVRENLALRPGRCRNCARISVWTCWRWAAGPFPVWGVLASLVVLTAACAAVSALKIRRRIR